jgi:hypothetical protein
MRTGTTGKEMFFWINDRIQEKYKVENPKIMINGKIIEDSKEIISWMDKTGHFDFGKWAMYKHIFDDVFEIKMYFPCPPDDACHKIIAEDLKFIRRYCNNSKNIFFKVGKSLLTEKEAACEILSILRCGHSQFYWQGPDFDVKRNRFVVYDFSFGEDEYDIIIPAGYMLIENQVGGALFISQKAALKEFEAKKIELGEQIKIGAVEWIDALHWEIKQNKKIDNPIFFIDDKKIDQASLEQILKEPDILSIYWVRYKHLDDNKFELKLFAPDPSDNISMSLINNFLISLPKTEKKKWFTVSYIEENFFDFKTESLREQLIECDSFYDEEEVKIELRFLFRLGKSKISFFKEPTETENEIVYYLFVEQDSIENMLKTGYLKLEYFD